MFMIRVKRYKSEPAIFTFLKHCDRYAWNKYMEISTYRNFFTRFFLRYFT